jgi:hypothetical protein
MTPQAKAAKAQPTREFVCAYDYTDLYDRVLFQKVRYRTVDGRGKSFAYRRPNGQGRWISAKPDDADQYIYRLPQVFEAVLRGDDVWWTEGEKDADSLAEHPNAGVVATSHHGGAGHVHLEQSSGSRITEGGLFFWVTVTRLVRST